MLQDIIIGDCKEILPIIPDKYFQLAFADPPYWVGFKYEDTTDKQMDFIDPHWLVEQLTRVADTVLITPGMKNIFSYPQPKWMLGWFKPAYPGRNGMGTYNVWEPILLYGKVTKKPHKDAVTTVFIPKEVRERKKFCHPCPKPLKLLLWLIENFSNPNDKI